MSSRSTGIWHCVGVPEQASGDAAKRPEPTPEQPQKIEIIPLEPQKIIKRFDPEPLEKRDGSGGSGS